MNSVLTVLLDQAAQPQKEMSGFAAFLITFSPLILMFVLIYFITIRPQKRREKELRAMIDGMKVGDTVITIGGITGRVFNIQNHEVTISTSVHNTLLTFRKSAIATVLLTPEEEKKRRDDYKLAEQKTKAQKNAAKEDTKAKKEDTKDKKE